MNRLSVDDDFAKRELPDDWLVQLRRYGVFLSKNHWDGEDLAQEAAAKALQSYCHDDHTMPLLKKMTYHLWIDQLRKRQKEQLTAGPAEISDSIEHSQTAQIVELVDQLLGTLTSKQAITFFLKESFQYRSKELAEILGTTEEAVKATLIRARHRLASQFVQSIHPIDEKVLAILYPLFCEALTENDPSRLLHVIPTLEIFAKNRTFSKKQNFSPTLIAA